MSELLQRLERVAETMFERWDSDMRAGKLLTALTGRVKNYDPDVTAIREALAVHPRLVTALERIADPRNIHFAGDAQVVAREALALPATRDMEASNG